MFQQHGKPIIRLIRNVSAVSSWRQVQGIHGGKYQLLQAYYLHGKAAVLVRFSRQSSGHLMQSRVQLVDSQTRTTPTPTPVHAPSPAPRPLHNVLSNVFAYAAEAGTAKSSTLLAPHYSFHVGGCTHNFVNC